MKHRGPTARTIFLDPEFEALIPASTAEEQAQLEKSLKREGCRDALIVWRNGRSYLLLDGHTRYRICQKNDIKFEAKAISLPNRDAAKAWIIKNQIGRRNLDASQRAMLAAVLATLPAHRPAETDKDANLRTSSIPEAAAEMNVSERSVTDAHKVIDEGTQQLQDAVRDGKVSVSAAAKITTLPDDEQDRLAGEGKRAVAQAGKKMKIMTLAEYEGTAPIKDRVGKEIPSDKPKIIEVFARRNEITKVMSALSKIKSDVLKAAKGKDPIYAELSITIFEMFIDNPRRTLQYAAPYAVCPECEGEGCKECKGKGWIGERAYEQVCAAKVAKLSAVRQAEVLAEATT